MELEFWKLTGAGNDFVAVDNREGIVPEAGRPALVAKWCRRGLGIGADGCLLIEPSDMADFRMRYYNSDGSEGETCGNGSRCIARFAHMLGVAPAAMRFETMAGCYEARIVGDEVAVQMTDAHSFRGEIPIHDEVFDGDVHFVNTGVPHVVVFVKDLESAEVVRLGRHLRRHMEFAPAGTNVNFVKPTGASALSVRTYERGVEDETLACGTGSIASAIVSARNRLVAPPVSVTTRSGEVLTIGFQPSESGATNVTLQGSARIVYRGYVEYGEPTPDR